jgi:hypothetical protein
MIYKIVLLGDEFGQSPKKSVKLLKNIKITPIINLIIPANCNKILSLNNFILYFSFCILNNVLFFLNVLKETSRAILHKTESIKYKISYIVEHI